MRACCAQIEGPDDEPRFAMLETIREYGLERLEVSGESGTVQERHATYFASVAEALRPHLYGPDQGRIIARLEAEQGNMRAALAWAIEHADAATGLRLAANLRKFWLLRSQLTEGRDWLEQTLAMPGMLRRPRGSMPSMALDHLLVFRVITVRLLPMVRKGWHWRAASVMRSTLRGRCTCSG